jgi:hypothetical protein
MTAKVRAALPATDSVTITADSTTTQGTVAILTKGSAETSIQFQMPSNSWSVIYSSGQANKIEASATTVMPKPVSPGQASGEGERKPILGCIFENS